jgi:hypothetical protein
LTVHNVKRYCQCQNQCEKMGLIEIQKQTIAQRLKDRIALRAIAAEVGVDKRTVLLAEQKIKPLHT